MWLALLAGVLIWKGLKYRFFVEHGTEPGRALWLVWGPVLALVVLIAYKIWRVRREEK